ncbi:Z1 domain-containing protein [uncultured Pedobacter sp.]|uniref:Z1 domain-containing protein n=1 Tax=uncultured Pedobacter sp. TaxID=246139 RepID=UPI0025F24B65|nr:Z1 domain-containing protein [uncultured Pedobacter sp.]
MSELEKRVSHWHEEAMELAEMAFFAKRRNEIPNYWKLIQRALNFEKAAARLMQQMTAIEPSRSILYQGAVHLAINMDYFQEARKLLKEALAGTPPEEIKLEFEQLELQIGKRERIRKMVLNAAETFIEYQKEDLSQIDVERALTSAIIGTQSYFHQETIDELLNRLILQAGLESKNLVANPDYQVFAENITVRDWLGEKQMNWVFWEGYKKMLSGKNVASTTVAKLDTLTSDILNRIGDPTRGGVWDKRGMVVGDVQSGKTSNYVGLINKSADAGFRIVIVLTGLYENLRQQTQERLDEGFVGRVSDLQKDTGKVIGVGNFRKSMPVHPITHAGDQGDIRKVNLKNLPLDTNDYYVLAIKKNPSVLKNLLSWLYNRGDDDGEYKIIRKIPLLIIDDEADYASINVDKDFVSQINASIRAILALFEQSAFIGYTATPFANVFISDPNETEGKDKEIGGKRFRLGKDLFPEDFIINIPPPSNYIGYNKVFNASLSEEETVGMKMIELISDYSGSIPDKHKMGDPLPTTLPPSLRKSVDCFILACAIRSARGQGQQHSSMLVHVSWYVNWINQMATLVDDYLLSCKDLVRYDKTGAYMRHLEQLWTQEFSGHTRTVIEEMSYSDPRIIEHSWEEILSCLPDATEKIEVRAVHGKKKGENFRNIRPLDYRDYPEGLSVIAVGGNKLSRGLTLEGLSVSYFLRATKFYDTLLQMGRWFGYRPGYLDVCRLFTTRDLVLWYKYIANATDELKEQFDMMDLADRTPKNFGLKIKSAPGMLMISSAAKIKGAIDLSLSLSGMLLETYIISKDPGWITPNLNAAETLISNLGEPAGITRQGQSLIWEHVHTGLIETFISDYQTKQRNIEKQIVRGYIARQQGRGNLKDWTVVLISSTAATAHCRLGGHDVGLTLRTEENEGNGGVGPEGTSEYIIRKSHIISPPHEFLDMDQTDERYVMAKDETIKKSKAKIPPANPLGKYVRKFRGSEKALLIIYPLDPAGFGGTGKPAIGYAMSLPEIDGDIGIPYKVNERFIEEMFGNPAEDEEQYDNEEEN